jgi:hypothetical protein
MRQSSEPQRTADEIVEVRATVGTRVIVSRVNRSHLARVRQTLAAIDRIRSDAVRIGLFEVVLDPASLLRERLIVAASAPVECSGAPVVPSEMELSAWGRLNPQTPRFA